jgi:hypothetical protein
MNIDRYYPKSSAQAGRDGDWKRMSDRLKYCESEAELLAIKGSVEWAQLPSMWKQLLLEHNLEPEHWS